MRPISRLLFFPFVQPCAPSYSCSPCDIRADGIESLEMDAYSQIPICSEATGPRTKKCVECPSAQTAALWRLGVRNPPQPAPMLRPPPALCPNSLGPWALQTALALEGWDSAMPAVLYSGEAAGSPGKDFQIVLALGIQ